ncbi:Fe-S cluster assembly protein SufD [Pararhodonellum marinum]|uniref:Fe-S cluster assembly protein SufD n=1 Tax=Pararhodonellum marinum TaxID=2755358 RepID=UPI00189071E8|nr:Fe-S cluster assembly protein SufD [Pararhodonellum marinum]
MTNTKTLRLIDTFLNGLSEDFGAFADLKMEALDALRTQGLPALKEEEYKFTPISKKLESTFGEIKATQKINLTAAQVAAAHIPGLDAHVLVFNNGQWDQELSNFTGAEFQILSIEENEANLNGKIGAIAKNDRDHFVPLNSLTFQEGISLEIPKGKALTKPVLILHFVQALEGNYTAPRTYISAQSQTAGTFIEKTISLDEAPYFNNVVTEIHVGENAHIHYYRVQEESRSGITVNNFETNIHRDATFTSVVLTLQGDMLRNNLSLNLLDSGCEGNMYGLYLVNGKTHVDNHTNVDHTKPHAESNELYKGILADQSRGVFNGKIFVRQDAQKTNAFQQNNNILLSEDAIVNTKPQLEIWADDVKCSHGCTIGQLDEEALFYLRARGIGKESARGLLLYAFAGEVLEHIKEESFRDYCIGLLQERLGGSY